jgi:hypothetical protein
MNIKDRVLCALRGEMVDQVPFTSYAGLFPENERDPLMKEGEIGLVHRVPAYQSKSPNVKSKSEEFYENGDRRIRYTFETPVGSVYETLRTGGGYGTNLRYEFLIKRPEDYKVVEFMMRDIVYTPYYDGMINTEKAVGNDGVVIGNLKYTPIQQMLVLLMGPERYGIDYYENRDLFDSLYDAITEKDRELYRISAESPAEFFIYGDNITSDMIGLERFVKYAIPRYNEAADILHEKGKKLGVHMDGNLMILKDAIAESGIDFLEAFTPSPMFDMSVADARAAWPEKVMWINYTSCFHIAGPEAIKAHTLDLLRQSYPGDHFLISITENVPDNVRKESFAIIARTLKENGKLPLKRWNG